MLREPHSNDLLESLDFFLYYPGSRYTRSFRITNVMLVWTSCFSGPWLFGKMILLVFTSLCALWGAPATFFYVRSAICSVGHPAVSIQTPLCSHSFSLLCTSFVDLGLQKMCTRTCPGRVGAFSTAEKVFPFSLPLIISERGRGARDCYVLYSSLTRAPRHLSKNCKRVLRTQMLTLMLTAM